MTHSATTCPTCLGESDWECEATMPEVETTSEETNMVGHDYRGHGAHCKGRCDYFPNMKTKTTFTNKVTPRFPYHYVSVWTDIHGTTYHQELRFNGDRDVFLEEHEAWVRERHEIITYAVMVVPPEGLAIDDTLPY